MSTARRGFVVALAITAGCVTRPAPILITSVASDGPGSLRAAIREANSAAEPRRIVSELTPGSVVSIAEELPPIVGAGTRFDAMGLTVAPAHCHRRSGKLGCSGLVVSGPQITVTGLVATGFMFDGIAVRGAAARNVRIVACRAVGNLDDGIGISDFASGVLVEDCVLERNGFRTKGKGILVFDHAEAVLRNNTVRHNRDGVTISRRSRAELVGNRIEDNYDKGFGVAGASASGSGNVIARNGLPGQSYAAAAPNGDGVRITIDSRVEFADTIIEGNGDAGIVVIGTARLVVRGGRVASNGGIGVSAADSAVVDLHGVEVYGNRRGDLARRDAAIIRGPR